MDYHDGIYTSDRETETDIHIYIEINKLLSQTNANRKTDSKRQTDGRRESLNPDKLRTFSPFVSADEC